MRKGRRAMSRLVVTLACAVFAAAGLFAPTAFAAGRSIGPAPAAASGFARPAMRFNPRALPAMRPAGPWRAGRAHLRHHRGFEWAGTGWPWFDTMMPGPGLTVVQRPAPEIRPIDPDAFENLPVRSGIRGGPTPEPTIYRLEGPASRPVARVIRVAGGDEKRAGVRSRFAHAETGSLLLTVPRR